MLTQSPGPKRCQGCPRPRARDLNTYRKRTAAQWRLGCQCLKSNLSRKCSDLHLRPVASSCRDSGQGVLGLHSPSLYPTVCSQGTKHDFDCSLH